MRIICIYAHSLGIVNIHWGQRLIIINENWLPAHTDLILNSV